MAPRIILFIFLVLFAQGCTTTTPITTAVVHIGGETFTLDLALDDTTRAKGLMEQTSLPKDGGLLFVFPDSIKRSFWMKNCLMDIDLIFLDSRGTITALHKMIAELPQEKNETDWNYESRLGKYWSGGPSRFAIELAPGSIQRLKLRVNDRISLDLPLLKSMAR